MAAVESNWIVNLKSNKSTIVVGTLLVIAIIMFIVAFTYMSTFAGHKDDWNEIQKQVSQTFTYTGIGTFLLLLALCIFVIQDPTYTMIITLILSVQYMNHLKL